MKQKVLSLVIALCIIFTILPHSVVAAEHYGIYIGNTAVTSENCHNVIGPGISGTVTFDPEANVLTLDNAAITGCFQSGYDITALRLSRKDLTVCFIGKNEIAPADSGFVPESCSAIVSEYDLTFQAESDASVSIKATGGKSNYGMMLSGNLNLTGGSFIIESGDCANGSSIGILLEKTLQVNAGLTVRSGKASGESIAMVSGKDMHFLGNDALSVFSDIGSSSAALLCGGTLELNVPGTLQSGSASNGDSYCISCKTFTTNSSILSVDAGLASKGYSIGLIAETDVNLTAAPSRDYTFAGYDFSLSTGNLTIAETDWWYGNEKTKEPVSSVNEQKTNPLNPKQQYRYLRIISQDRLSVIPFEDVPRNAFYTDPVVWAVKENITTGTSTNPPLFSPKDTCTRGQVVTFLWRACGSPEPTSTENPFVDVQEGKFYYKAVLWAVENGITNGVDSTHFGPGQECTRGHVATFLWRSLNEPAASNPVNSFTDVQEGKFYFNAVLWAAQSGVTTGITATTFEPGSSCTRGQIVTFLWRAAGKPAVN